MASNRSAFLDGENKPLRIAESAIPTPGPTDIIVRNHAVAINTIDPAQVTGFNVKRYPTVLGHDLAGQVHEIGSEVTRFAKGDRVIAHAWQFLTGNAEDGAFSHYTRVPAANAAILPDGLGYTQGVVLPLAIDTAAAGFYQKTHLDLDLPSVDTKPASNGKVVIVYGGSSSVGAAAIQLASLAGYRVIATASPAHFDLCRECGATDVFDYKSSTIAADIAAAVGKDQFVGLYNAIGIPESFEVVLPIMEKLGGGMIANTKPPGKLPDNVTARFVLGIGDFSFPVWENFVGKALAEGKLKCLPKPKVVGKGLESLQHAFEVRDGSVSAEKIVVEL
ncbi:Zinc-binding dehydrogenase-like protein 11 [Elsinoe fawcettii]|nr:Zinc-binding dehydrogenase-like protein 11 [Elsinoe fawcettii]